MVDSRAEYFKERRKEKKNFSVYVEKDLSEKVEEKMQSENKTKTKWLNQQMENYMDNEPSEGISLKRWVKCPSCNNDIEFDFDDYLYDTEHNDRSMGAEIIYSFGSEDNECPCCHEHFVVEGYICEYPEGAFNDQNISVSKKDDEGVQ